MMRQLYSGLSAIGHAISPQMEKIGHWEKLALQQMGAKGFRIANHQQDSQILKQIQSIYDREGMNETPKVILYEQEMPNAAFIHTGTITVSTGLLDQLDKEQQGVNEEENVVTSNLVDGYRHELETVLAHEITHQKQNIANMMAIGAYQIGKYATSFGAAYAFNKKGPQKLKSNVFAILAVAGVVHQAAKYLFAVPLMAMRRNQEFAADEGAAWMTRKPDKLISALSKLENYFKNYKAQRAAHKIPQTDPHASLVSPTMHAGSGLEAKLHRLYAAHPPTPERIERLNEIHRQQVASGQHYTQLPEHQERDRKIQGEHSAKVVAMTQSEESHASSYPRTA